MTLKIGIFTETYLPTVNGVVISIGILKKELEKLGHEVYIFAPHHPEAQPDETVFRFPSFQIPKFKTYPFVWPILSWHKKRLPSIVSSLDIFHTQHLFTMGRLARLLARKYQKPLVYTYHTLLTEYAHYFPYLPKDLIEGYLISRSRNFCNQTDRVITPSEAMKKLLIGYGVKTEIAVIPTGIYLENYRKIDSREIKKIWHIPSDRKILLYVGRLAQEKNIYFLLDAFQKVQTKYPKIHLILVGSGPEETKIVDYLQKFKLKNFVTITGFLPREKTYQMFGAADIFVFPSVSETQGIVVIESLASETPVVVANKMGPADIIKDGENGFLSELRVDQFMQKIYNLLTDSELYQKFQKNGKITAGKYVAPKLVEKIASIYEKLLHRQNS